MVTHCKDQKLWWQSNTFFLLLYYTGILDLMSQINLTASKYQFQNTCEQWVPLIFTSIQKNYPEVRCERALYLKPDSSRGVLPQSDRPPLVLVRPGHQLLPGLRELVVVAVRWYWGLAHNSCCVIQEQTQIHHNLILTLWWFRRCYSAFTLTETESDNGTETHKMATVFNGISVSVQFKYIHTILYKQFFVVLGLCLCERSLSTADFGTLILGQNSFTESDCGRGLSTSEWLIVNTSDWVPYKGLMSVSLLLSYQML